MVRKEFYSALYYMPDNIVKAANKRLLKDRPSAISGFKKTTEKDHKILYVSFILVYIRLEKNNTKVLFC